MKRIAAATACTAGLGLVGLGAASVAEAFPGPAGPMLDDQWCPGQFWDPGWGNNWDWNNCHGGPGGPGLQPNGGPGPGPIGPNGMPNGGPGPGPWVPNGPGGPGGGPGGPGGGPGGWNGGGHGGH